MVKFVVDSMLGKLVRWLRILGYDCVYWKGEDKELIAKAVESSRIVLTRDKMLFNEATKLGAKAVLLDQVRVKDLLKSLSYSLGISLEFNPYRTRCPNCNNLLETLAGGRRWRCSVCGKEYWMGSHWRKISSTLREVTEMSKHGTDVRSRERGS